MNLFLQNRVILISDYGDSLVPAIAEQLEAMGAITRRILSADKEEMIRQVCLAGEQYGGIDGLVNTLAPDDRVGLEDGDYEGFVKSLELNVAGMFTLTQASLPWLVISHGAIVNMISPSADTGKGGSSGYVAASGGRKELTSSWARELSASGIRVMGIVAGKKASHREITDSVAFLLSKNAAGLQGEFVYIDGGYVHLERSLNNL